MLDSLIANGSLNSFIIEMYEQVNEDKLWEYYLHKVFEMTWGEFLDSTKPVKTEKVDVGKTILKSKKMLDNFTPIGGE